MTHKSKRLTRLQTFFEVHIKKQRVSQQAALCTNNCKPYNYDIRE